MLTNQLFGVKEKFWFITFADYYGVNSPTNGFQATKVMSLNMELGKDVHSHIVSVQALAPTHHGWL